MPTSQPFHCPLVPGSEEEKKEKAQNQLCFFKKCQWHLLDKWVGIGGGHIEEVKEAIKFFNDLPPHGTSKLTVPTWGEKKKEANRAVYS